MPKKHIKEHKLLSPATLGKNKVALKDLITASDGNPVIAPEGDKMQSHLKRRNGFCKSQLNRERKKMQNEKKNTKFVSPEIRSSFPHLVKPAEEKFGSKFSVSLGLPKDNEEAVEALFEVIRNAAENKWGPKAPEQVGNSIKIFVEDCDELEKYKDDPVYKGCLKFSAKSDRRPGLVDPKLNPVALEDIEDFFYPGAIVRVSVTAYGTETGGSRTIAFGLNNVMFVRDGERIGGGSKAEDDFADYKDETYDRFEQSEDDVDEDGVF